MNLKNLDRINDGIVVCMIQRLIQNLYMSIILRILYLDCIVVKSCLIVCSDFINLMKRFIQTHTDVLRWGWGGGGPVTKRWHIWQTDTKVYTSTPCQVFRNCSSNLHQGSVQKLREICDKIWHKRCLKIVMLNGINGIWTRHRLWLKINSEWRHILRHLRYT